MYAASAVEVAVIVSWKFVERGERGGRRVVALAHGVHGNIAVEGGSVRDCWSHNAEMKDEKIGKLTEKFHLKTIVILQSTTSSTLHPLSPRPMPSPPPTFPPHQSVPLG